MDSSHSTSNNCRSRETAGVRCFHVSTTTTTTTTTTSTTATTTSTLDSILPQSRRVYDVKDLADFNSLLEAAEEKLVLVYFSATWCGYSKMISPHVEKISRTRSDVVVLKVDVDDCEDVTDHYEITSMPPFIFFKNKVKIDEMIGANVEKLKKKIFASTRTTYYPVRSRRGLDLLKLSKVARICLL